MSNVYTKINVRSPYIVSTTGASAGQLIKVELYIHQSGGSEPASATFSLSKNIPSANLLTVNFDISPYLKSYISHTSLTPVTGLTVTTASNYVYCKVVVTNPAASVPIQYLIGYKGYGYFQDGMNPVLDANIMLDEGEYYLLKNQNNGALFYSIDSDASPAEDWDAKYVCLDGSTADVDINLNTQDNAYIPYITPTHKNNGGSTLKIFKDSSLYKTFTFTEVCEPKYTPVVCDFVNKYGVWQTIIFFKVSKSNIVTDSSKFNLMPASVNYNTSKNITQNFNVNGQETITVNTGFVREGYSDVIQQILLSETIRLDGRPVVPNSKSVDLQKHINDKLINYTMKFDYAHPTINNIQ
tara:strand:- start:5450 stop:6511 length:1062 start_codon:yes stop_codon:yes gene_type:complete